MLVRQLHGYESHTDMCILRTDSTYLSTDLSFTFPSPFKTSAMFGKLSPVECSLIPAPGASDNLLALFCLKKMHKCIDHPAAGSSQSIKLNLKITLVNINKMVSVECIILYSSKFTFNY